jgi:hypothetical protein
MLPIDRIKMTIHGYFRLSPAGCKLFIRIYQIKNKGNDYFTKILIFCTKGTFINDVIQIWVICDPLPPLPHKNCYFIYLSYHNVINLSLPYLFPQILTSFVNVPLLLILSMIIGCDGTALQGHKIILWD